MSHAEFDPLAARRIIDTEARALGFDGVGISATDLAADEAFLERWLAAGFHGEMDYMARHGSKRSRPSELVPGTISVIAVRLDYLPPDSAPMAAVLADPKLAYISRYALGRDYHKLMRQRLQKLADRLTEQFGVFGYRALVDSAPVLERALARNAGLGFIGKNANLIHTRHGSWFFLGELYTDLPLIADAGDDRQYCGTCTRCLDDCPTGAIVAPNQVDARRCISYLTIELQGAIPEHMRAAIGNRIYGCDDCQLVCPWNKFAAPSQETGFRTRHGLDRAQLVDLFAWSEAEFLSKTEGSPIRRIGHTRWLRNIAVALGNAAPDPAAKAALQSRMNDPSELVREHVLFALGRFETA